MKAAGFDPWRTGTYWFNLPTVRGHFTVLTREHGRPVRSGSFAPGVGPASGHGGRDWGRGEYPVLDEGAQRAVAGQHRVAGRAGECRSTGRGRARREYAACDLVAGYFGDLLVLRSVTALIGRPRLAVYPCRKGKDQLRDASSYN